MIFLDNDRLFLIDEMKGFTTEFSKLISMMNYARDTTLQAVGELTVEQLDYLYDESANSIGMLLAHMVAVEKAYQMLTFGGLDGDEEEFNELDPALDLGKVAKVIRGHSIDYYLKELEKVRNETLNTFKTLPDSWLYEQVPFWYGKQANNFFQWFRVFEDEINHRGQIRIINKMYDISTKGKLKQ